MNRKDWPEHLGPLRTMTVLAILLMAAMLGLTLLALAVAELVGP